MPQRVLAVLDANLIERFVKGPPSRSGAARELQHRLGGILKHQGGEDAIWLTEASGDTARTSFALSAMAVGTIHQLQSEAHASRDAKIVMVEFGPTRKLTLIQIGTMTYHVSNQTGEAKELWP